jgi:hypothetical protein
LIISIGSGVRRKNFMDIKTKFLKWVQEDVQDILKLDIKYRKWREKKELYGY